MQSFFVRSDNAHDRDQRVHGLVAINNHHHRCRRCTAMNGSITPTGVTSATIAYTATCAGVPVTGTANGTLNGTTLNWTTTGAAASACPFALNGTAVPGSATDLRVAYSGTVCGVPVSGDDVLRR